MNINKKLFEIMFVMEQINRLIKIDDDFKKIKDVYLNIVEIDYLTNRKSYYEGNRSYLNGFLEQVNFLFLVFTILANQEIIFRKHSHAGRTISTTRKKFINVIDKMLNVQIEKNDYVKSYSCLAKKIRNEFLKDNMGFDIPKDQAAAENQIKKIIKKLILEIVQNNKPGSEKVKHLVERKKHGK